ncbi:HEAT repeat protein-like protein [Dendryphion nanum]|uniref:HEAT repeat protein-like protein n=1 Tax=Dendryphion nanum TaxID=256645 RepID=A0A9P9IFI9_9PLEO|nr:HEAT repeat protein-like protein [Dendryphion nanum]
MERREIFQRLRTNCVELIQIVSSLTQRPNAKKDVVQSLVNLLQTLQVIIEKPDSLDEKLAEFVFVPISQVLRQSQKVPVRALELSLHCISILLRTGWKGNISPELSSQLLILFTFLSNPSSAENGIPATSEELQALAFRCMAELLTEITQNSQGRKLLTQTSNIPTIGKAVLVMVDSLAKTPSNDVKLQSLAAIRAFSEGVDDLDALASFLPRIVSSLTKVLTPSSSNRAGFRVLEHGLNTMSFLLSTVLSDHKTENLPSQATQEGQEDSEKVLRTKSWLQATSSQIKIALANILKLRRHDKREVRHALLQLCLGVIQDCRRSLTESISMVVETLINLSGYDGDQDKIESDLGLLLSTDEQLAGLLRESLHGWVVSLPRLMLSKDDATRRQVIQQVSMALRLLTREGVDLTMVNDLLAGNIRDSVSTIFTDDQVTASITEPKPDHKLDTALVYGDDKLMTFEPLKLRFKSQDDIMGEFRLLIGEISRSKAADFVARDLVNTIEYGPQEMRIATFWLSVNLVKDMVQHNAAFDDFLDLGTSDLQTELLDELYSLSLTNLTRVGSDSEPDWRAQALSLEVLALQANKHKEDFRGELIEALYPVLHLLGSPISGLRERAITCLNIIANACGYVNATDLIISNVDYVVNAVGLKLNYHEVSPQAPQVLLMMMRLCGPSLLPYLDDLVGSMFSALERYHGYPKLVELLFSVLRGMTEEGVKNPQLLIEGSDKTVSENKTWHTITIREVVTMLDSMKQEALKEDKERHKTTEASFPPRPWKETTKDGLNDNPSEEAEEDHAENDVQPTPDLPPPAPRTFDILLKISELTQHYLTSSSPSLRTSLISLLHTTIPALAKHENSFLPLVNTLWPVLLPRLDDSEAYVVANTLDIMALMCIHAGDFMKSRIEGMWEDIKALNRRILPKTKSQTYKSNSNSISLSLNQSTKVSTDLEYFRPELYTDTPTRMIRESLYQFLSAVAQYVTVRGEQFDAIVDMLDPVIEKADIRRSLESRNPDAVWLRLRRKMQQNSLNDKIKEFAVIGNIPTGKPEWVFIQV